MISDALAGEQKIGMVLLQESLEQNDQGAPTVFPIGCVGKMEAHERVEQGRYNILLRGLSRFEIVDFVQEHPYRIARVRMLADVPLNMEIREQIHERNRLLDLFEHYLNDVMGVEVEKDILERTGSLETVINQVAATLDIPVLDKQMLLQIAAVSERYSKLRTLMDNRLRVAQRIRHLTIVPDDPALN
jgi:Lon protease-like protein